MKIKKETQRKSYEKLKEIQEDITNG